MSVPGGDVYTEPWRAIASWFLGPRAENRQELNSLMLDALNWHADCREGYFPADPSYITEEVKRSDTYQMEMADMKDKMKEMHDSLGKSMPFFSTRYQGHMIWDVTLPSMLGYMSGLLWNQNNVDSTASPVTTQYEVIVGKELCDLMRFPRDGVYEPWGHITSCGSVANVEAMWAARNMKFHPVALQGTCMDPANPTLADGGKTVVFVPSDPVPSIPRTLESLTQWELLNLNVDDICKMTDDVKAMLGDNADDLEPALEKYSLIQLGIGDFIIKNNIQKMPKICSPGTNHYSWPKSATILGIGDSNLIPIPVDGKARQNLTVLQEKLDECLANHIPVLMCVAVIGSTEESSMDPLSDICDIRDQYALKGLNFTVHADAAWGGYLAAMTHTDPSPARKSRAAEMGNDFIPPIPLSDFVDKQYRSLHRADTVTVDPHKAGFCPYPAGALLYRNGTMKGFITLAAPEVFHNADDITVGIYGLEGSKPGAAACGVLLSHRVIGLDIYGYGRILGQCQLGSKLFYSMWFTVARDEDNFICKNMIDAPYEELPGLDTEEDVRNFMNNRVLGRPDSDLHTDVEAMEFLRKVGPDALINQFTINLIDSEGVPNTDVQITNELQNKIFDELTAYVGQPTKRIPFFLTTSELSHKTYGAAVDQLKDRLGLPSGNEDALRFLRNTCMQPFQSSGQYVTILGSIFRTAVMNCIGALSSPIYGDPESLHTFVVAGTMNEDGKIFLDMIPSFVHKHSQYHVILTMKCHDQNQIQLFRNAQSAQPDSTFFITTTVPKKLITFLRDLDSDNQMVVKIGDPLGSASQTITLKIDEVFRFNHFENPAYANYPDFQTYFMYGDDQQAFLSHVITKQPDFHQVVKLDELPHSVPLELLDIGSIITIPDLQGTPLELNSEISDPLQQDFYTVNFKGKQYVDCQTTVKFYNSNSKVWFDSTYINGSSPKHKKSKGKGKK